MAFNVNETSWKKALDIGMLGAGLYGMLGMVAALYKGSELEQKKKELEKLAAKRHAMESYIEHLLLMRTALARLVAAEGASDTDIDVQLHRRDIAVYNTSIAIHKERIVELDVQMETLTKEVTQLQKQEDEERKKRLDEERERESKRNNERDALVLQNIELTARLTRIKNLFRDWADREITATDLDIEMRQVLGLEPDVDADGAAGGVASVEDET